MAIFNMIGGGGESGDTYVWKLVYTKANPSTPYSNTSNYFGYALIDSINAPAYITNKWSSSYYSVQVYNEDTASISDKTITTYDFSPSSTSYSGMSPLPKKAPASSGSIYYFNIPSGSYAGTWAWVYTSSELRLYKWDVLEILTLKTTTYTLTQNGVTSLSFSNIPEMPKAYWAVMTNTGTYTTRTNGVTSVVCGKSSRNNPIFTYMSSSVVTTGTGTASNAYISNSSLTFTTSGIEYYLYFAQGIWTLYYLV